jgi:hypothetical protein
MLVLLKKYWAGLNKETEKNLILEGAHKLQGMALGAHRRSRSRSMLQLADLGDRRMIVIS